MVPMCEWAWKPAGRQAGSNDSEESCSLSCGLETRRRFNSSLRQSDGPRHEPIKAFGYYLGYQSSKRTSIPEPSSAF
jgi:hypothetical protein